MAKQIRVSFRTTEGFKQRLADAAEKLGLDQSVLGTAALEAVIAHIEKHGSLTIPIKLAGTTTPEKTGADAPTEHAKETPPTRGGGSSQGYTLNEEPPHSGASPKKEPGHPRQKNGTPA